MRYSLRGVPSSSLLPSRSLQLKPRLLSRRERPPFSSLFFHSTLRLRPRMRLPMCLPWVELRSL